MRNDPAKDVNFFKTSEFDLIIIGLILFTGLFFGLRAAWNNQQAAPGPQEILIYHQGRLLEKIGLLGENKVISLLNARMQVEIKGKKVRVLNSDCPHRLCVNMGWISYSGQSIACVPNQILIEIKSSGSSLLDAVSY